MRNLFFWQNIVSPHQSSVLKQLSFLQGFTVTLIVEKNSEIRRTEMGWGSPDIGLTKVVVAPEKNVISEIVRQNRAGFHIFSGTRGYKMVWFALKTAMQLKCHIAIMSEPGDWIGFKGVLRKWRNQLDAIYLQKKVKCILAIGHNAVQWFKLSGYPTSIIYDWGYFVDPPSEVARMQSRIPHDQFSIIYVGRLSREKGVTQFIEQVAQIDLPFRLTIIGEGPEADYIRQGVSKHNLEEKTSFLNFMSNQDVFKHIAEADVLVLPSTGKDGWGVVVNEALLMGTPVICSLNCGAAVLASNSANGQVYNPDSDGELYHLLKGRIALGPITQAARIEIQNWARNISSEVAARYLVDVLVHTMQQRGERPSAPWMGKGKCIE